MRIGNKEILMVGDRVLIRPDKAEERTRGGLYLPQTVVEKDPVQSGRVVATGPGVAVPNFSHEIREPWEEGGDESSVRHIPPQARVGDHVLLLRKEAIEIVFEEEKYLVAPQSALLLIIRGE